MPAETPTETPSEVRPELSSQDVNADFAADVRAGLSRPGQKELPSKYFYDEVGSALFEVITALPEYGLCRADERLLREHAGEIAQSLSPAPVRIAELGSGSGKKTRAILEAFARLHKTHYHPIEISQTALARCAKELGDIDGITVEGFAQTYLEGLQSVAAIREHQKPGREENGDKSPAVKERLLVLFLGSTIGNFDRQERARFLMELRHTFKPGDALLLGADLLKPLPLLLAAYDDPLGVTASFNLNILARINRELGANFALDRFRHIARFDETERRIEMHLLSLQDQTVVIPAANCVVSFAEGETIWTESSYKYLPAEIVDLGRRGGFRLESQWIDLEWPFAETLLIAE